MPTMHVVPEARRLKPGQKVIVTVAGTEVGIYNVGGRLHAVRNVCADQGGPLCQGDVFERIEADFRDDHTLHEYIKEGRALVACPWHGWEYDLVTGRCL